MIHFPITNAETLKFYKRYNVKKHTVT